MNMDRRLNGIEKQLAANKEAKCELEVTIGSEGSDASYAKLSPDGQRKEIGYQEAQRLMVHDRGGCEVSLVD